MLHLTFDKDSWHYKMAQRGDYWPDRDDAGNEVGDICDYTRAIFKAMLLACMVAALFAVISFFVVHMLLGIGFSIWYGTWLFTKWGEGMLFITVVGSIVGTLFFISSLIVNWWNNRKYRAMSEPDGFVKNAYLSWKEKYCARITFIRSGD